MELYQFAKYPFLKNSLQYTKEQGLTLEELLTNHLYERARALGMQRVKEALECTEIKEHDLSTTTAQLMELLSYPFARILVSCINDKFLVRRYALAEAATACKRMFEESAELVELVAKEFFTEIYRVDDFFKIHFSEHLKYSSNLRSVDWKLVNCELNNGWVKLAKKDFIRLLQEVIRAKIDSELPIEVDKELKQSLKRYTSELDNLLLAEKKAFLPSKTFGKITIIKFPPCMRKLLASIENNENVPHAGRFALTSFLHSIGVGNEEILKIFATTPDFDERKARYQIEHITGKISGTVYTPPECRTMRTYGLCYEPDELCKKEWLTHPLKYYRAKERAREKQNLNSDKSLAQ
ncbi:MAG: DNA primase large subunit PriL [Candidatus Thermoplasmatota archaeon]